MHRLGQRPFCSVFLDPDRSGDASRGKAAGRVHLTEYGFARPCSAATAARRRAGVRRMVGAIPQPDTVIGASPLSGLGRLSSLGNDIGEGKSKAARQFAIYTAAL